MHTIFDIACNFTNERFDKDLNDVISRSFDNNITKFGLICSQLKDVQKIIKIKDLYPDSIYFTLGVHPHNSNEINEFSLQELHDFIKKFNPNAVGETGLDFYRNLSTYEEQTFAFEEQIKIAIELNKPLFLHQRDSHDEFMKIIKKYSSDIPKAVVHCFTGTQSQLDDYLELDFYVGLTGWICDEKRNIDLRKAIKNIPLSKLMIETDCPYLIPKNLPNKSNRNEPSNLNHIANEIAFLMEVDEDSLRKETYENSVNFFNA